MKLSERYAKEVRDGLHKVPTKDEIESNECNHSYVYFVKAKTNFEEGYQQALLRLDDYKSGKIRAIPGEIDEYIEYVNNYFDRPRVAAGVVDFIEHVESNHLEDVVLCELEENSWDEFKQAVVEGYYRAI